MWPHWYCIPGDLGGLMTIFVIEIRKCGLNLWDAQAEFINMVLPSLVPGFVGGTWW